MPGTEGGADQAIITSKTVVLINVFLRSQSPRSVERVDSGDTHSCRENRLFFDLASKSPFALAISAQMAGLL
jgi:hypothetical protein